MSTAAAAPTFQTLPLAAIHPSKLNPRRRFDEAKLQELAESIRRDGVLEPILVRPVPAKDGPRFAIVAGERRWRAARLAKLAEIPAIVREMSEAQALEIAVVENLQRQDLNPIEEAEGFERLVQHHRYAVEDLAAKVGKSRTYVYTRLRLTGLPEAAKTALWEDRLAVNVALLIARIPDPRLQEEATKTILHGGGGEGPMGFREAARYIHEEFMLALDRAPFPTDDATLVPEAGSCGPCPKRTSNDRDLFGDVTGKADLCTDPTCFAAKKEAMWARVRHEAELGGPPVLDDKQSKGLFHFGRLGHHTRYVDLLAACEDDPQRRNWQKLLGKHAPKGVLARDDEGRVHRLIPRGEAAAALKKAGHRFAVQAPRAEDGTKRPADDQRQEVARRRRLEILRRTAEQAVASVVSRVEQKEPDLRLWRALLDGVAATAWHDVLGTVAKRRGWLQKKHRPEEVVRDQVQRLAVPQLRALLAEIVLTRDAFRPYGSPSYSKPLTLACQAAGIDLRKVERQVKQQVGQKGGKAKANKTK